MRLFKTALLAGLVVCLVGGAASAQTKFTASLEPESPGAGNGKGTATLALDPASKTLNWTIEYSGLSAPPAMAALMSEPSTPNGPPGQVPLTLPPGAASPIKGAVKLTDAQIASLKTKKWFLAIGTQQAPEIGGDLKPAP
jgi:hypothetical protein